MSKLAPTKGSIIKSFIILPLLQFSCCQRMLSRIFQDAFKVAVLGAPVVFARKLLANFICISYFKARKAALLHRLF